MEEPKEEVPTVQIVWPSSVSDVPTYYSNVMYITHAGPEFFLVFGEFVAPSPDAPRPTEIEIRPLFKVAVTPEVMANIAEAAKANFAKYLERISTFQFPDEEA